MFFLTLRLARSDSIQIAKALRLAALCLFCKNSLWSAWSPSVWPKMQNALLFGFFALISAVLPLLALVLVSPCCSLCLAYSSVLSFMATSKQNSLLQTSWEPHRKHTSTCDGLHLCFRCFVGWCAHPKSRHSRSSSPVCARWRKNYNAPPALPARPYFPRFFLPKRRAKTLSFILKDSVRKCLLDQFRLLQSHPGAT